MAKRKWEHFKVQIVVGGNAPPFYKQCSEQYRVKFTKKDFEAEQKCVDYLIHLLWNGVVTQAETGRMKKRLFKRVVKKAQSLCEERIKNNG